MYIYIIFVGLLPQGTVQTGELHVPHVSCTDSAKNKYKMYQKPEQTSVRLQLTSVSHYSALLEFLRVQHFLVHPRPTLFTDYIYRGMDWEVSIRRFADERYLLRVRTKMEEKDGVASYGFHASLPVDVRCCEAFQNGLLNGFQTVSPSLASQGGGNAAPLIHELQNIIELSHGADHPVYHEMEVQRWACRGSDSMLRFSFFLRRCAALDRSPGQMSRGEEYWLDAPAGPWGSPEDLMRELQEILRTLGIQANRHTIEKPERIEKKKDVKIRIYSSYGYATFLKEAQALMTPRSRRNVGTTLHSGSEMEEHVDHYYDTRERHLSQSHCSIRFRVIRQRGKEAPDYQLALQRSISVKEGQQERNWVALPLASSVAAKATQGDELFLEDLGREAENWKSLLQSLMPEDSKLICVATFKTIRHKFPWFSSTSQPIHQTTWRTASQTTSTVRSPLVIHLDHTIYRYISTREQCGTSAPLQFYEVEVTNIETSPEHVMNEMVMFLNSIDVEWQLSVNNKIQQFFEFENTYAFFVYKKKARSTALMLLLAVLAIVLLAASAEASTNYVAPGVTESTSTENQSYLIGVISTFFVAVAAYLGVKALMDINYDDDSLLMVEVPDDTMHNDVE
eukprot:gene4085-2933_t